MRSMMQITFVFLIFKPVIGQVKKQLYLVQIYQVLIADPIEGFQSSPFFLMYFENPDQDNNSAISNFSV